MSLEAVQFAVAAVYGRRNLLIQKPAVIDRRYSKPNCATTTSQPSQGGYYVWITGKSQILADVWRI
jgi:hypothetical protein